MTQNNEDVELSAEDQEQLEKWMLDPEGKAAMLAILEREYSRGFAYHYGDNND